MATADRARSDNQGVLAYLGRAGTDVGDDPHPDEADRYHLGTHPDIVEHLWDVLATAFDGDARSVLLATPVLVDPPSGEIMAVGLGTTYALRMTPADAAAVVAAGGTTVHEYRSVGRTLDLADAFGPGWVFGSWRDDEVDLLRRAAISPPRASPDLPEPRR